MGDFTPRDFHLDTFLSGFSIGYRTQGAIADQLFPVIPVAKETNAYAKIDKGAWFRIPNTNRAPGTRPNTVRYTVSSDNYRAKNYALSEEVPVEVIANADQPFTPLINAVNHIQDLLTLDYEVRVEALITGGVGSSVALTGTNAWSDYGGSDPLRNFRVAREAIRATTGRTPNLCVMGELTWQWLQYHPDVVRALYPGAGIGGVATPDGLTRLIGVDRVLIGTAIKDTSNENAATNAFTDVWSTHCHLLYVEANPGLMTPTFGATFRWNAPELTTGGPGNFAVERKYDDDRMVEIVRTGYYQDEKVIAAELGFTIKTGITGA